MTGVATPRSVPADVDIAELQRRLHDGVLQLLEYMSVGGWGAMQDPSAYRELARRAADDLRATVESRPATGTFGDAVDRCLADVRRQYPALEWDLDIAAACRLLAARDVESVVHALREALTNVARHARASCARVSIRHEGDRVVVDVRDDGCGFDPARADGFGLRNSIRARMQCAGGAVRVRSALHRGTCVSIELPLRSQRATPAPLSRPNSSPQRPRMRAREVGGAE